MMNMSSIDFIQNIIHKFEQTTPQKLNLNQDYVMMHQIQSQLNDLVLYNANNDGSDDGNESIHDEQQKYLVQDAHLIYFDFTNCLLSSFSSPLPNNDHHSKHKRTTTSTKQLTKSLIKLLLLSIEKYGAKNIKIYLNTNNINSNNKNNDMIHQKYENLSKQLIDFDIKDNKHKIDMISIKCKNNDINSHLKCILDNHLCDEQYKYRKISIINIDSEQTNHKYIERSLVDNQTFNAENIILHNQPIEDIAFNSNHIFDIFEEYFFDQIENKHNDNDNNNDIKDEEESLGAFAMPTFGSDFAMPAFHRSDSSVF